MSKTKLLLAALYIVGIAIFFTHQTEEAYISNSLVYLSGPIAAFVAGFFVLRRTGWTGKRSVTLQWVWFSAILWMLAEFVYSYLMYQGSELYPSLADVLFLLGYIGFAIALVSELRLFNLKLSNIPTSRLSFLALVFAAALSFFTYIAINSYDESVGWFVNLVTLGWSIGDIITGGLALLLLGLIWDYQGGTVRYEWLWILLGLAANFAADTVYSLNPEIVTSVSFTGTVLNAIWYLGYFFFAAYFVQIYEGVTRFQNKINFPVT
jgi:hypothetical protein